MDQVDNGFSVVIPVFDEEQALRSTLDAIAKALSFANRSYEIVVVDDGSTDATPQILAGYKGLTVLRHAHNRGYGAALKTGIAAARHPLIVVVDADGTYPVVTIPALVTRCANADMVVGARVGSEVHSTPARGAVKWCFRQFAQWITGAAIPDLNSGLRVFRRTIAERFLSLLPDGFSFTTTITVASLAEQLVVYFEPVDYKTRIGRSKIRPLRDTARIGKQLIRLGIHLSPWRTSLVFCAPLALVGIGLAVDHLHAGVAVGGAAQMWGIAAAVVGGFGWCAERRVRRRRDGSANLMPARHPLG